MSTKRLSKTVIEGGRHGYNKWERRHSHAEVRAEERDYLKQITIDPDLSDEIEIGENRPVYKEFTDKLAPMYRWLDSQIGRPWSEVRSEIFKTFDTRTTAGRHITFDHLLSSVVETNTGFDRYGRLADPNIPREPVKGQTRRYFSSSSYYVDQNGILCADEERNKRYYRKWEPVTEDDYKFAATFLKGRMIGEKGGKLFWFAPSEDIWLATWIDPNRVYYDVWGSHKLAYYVLDNGLHETLHTVHTQYSGTYTTKINTHGDFWAPVENPFSFRQRGELSEEEVKTFKSLKYKIRQDILAFSKGR